MMLGSRFDLVETINLIAERHVAEDQSTSHVDVNSRCNELEREMMKVAVSVHSSNTRVNIRCPICDERMAIKDERPVAEFGSLDVRLHKLECTACGMATGRVFHPAVGYRDLIR